MLILLQDARKLDFSGKFDAVWLGPYLVSEVCKQLGAIGNFE
jgi:hypothetical protein